jgi:predicted XRE-type DNA-binding protein
MSIVSPLDPKSLPTLPDPQELMSPMSRAMVLAEALLIDSDEVYEYAADEFMRIKGGIKALEEKRKEFTAPLDRLKKSWMEFFGAPIAQGERVKLVYEGKLYKYKAEQDAKRVAEERKIREAHELEIRQAAEQAAALQRAAIEAASKADAERKAGNAEAAIVLEATAAAQVHAAEIVQEQVQVTVAPVVQIQAPKVSGLSYVKHYSATIDDLPALLAAIVAGNESIGLIDEEAVLKKVQARARLEKTTFKITGCSLVSGQGIRSGRA